MMTLEPIEQPLIQFSRCKCPTCGIKLDGVTKTAEGKQPGLGDISVCMYCATILKVQDTDTGYFELVKIESNDPAVLKMAKLIKEFWEERGGPPSVEARVHR